MKVSLEDLSRQYKKYKNEFDSIITSVFENGSFILRENFSKFEKNFVKIERKLNLLSRHQLYKLF